MTRRAMVMVTVLLPLAFATGCGSGAQNPTTAVKVVNPPAPAGPVQLAAFDDGIGAVASGNPAPLWRETGAVAALDGSAVFSIRPDEAARSSLVRLDERTGAATATWPITTGLAIEAVSPAGRWIALTNRARGYGSQGRTSTEMTIFDTNTASVTHHMTLTGDVQPEAFSVDGNLVFALHYLGDHYRVQTIELDSGLRFDTSDRNKTLPVEDMHGHAVHGVMSADRTLLATLYRNPGDSEEPAFLHVLDLTHGWSYCADLPAPFGSGAAGSDTIELTTHDTVVVSASQANRLAEIHIDAVHTPGDSPVPVVYRTGTIPSLPASLVSIPGFGYVIAPIPA